MRRARWRRSPLPCAESVVGSACIVRSDEKLREEILMAYQGQKTEEHQDPMHGDGGDAKAQPSGPKGDNPGTAGQGDTRVNSGAGEQGEGQLKPSAPGETGTTPGTNWKQK